MKCFHAHTPSQSPTPSHKPMPSVANVTGNANDTQVPSLCRLTNTQCNLPLGNPSRVNLDSYHSILGLSDEHDRVFALGQQNFPDSTAGLSHPYKTFSDSTAGLSHSFRSFTPIRGLLHPFGSFTPKFQRRLTHVDYFSFVNLNYESLLDVVPKTNSTHIHQEW